VTGLRGEVALYEGTLEMYEAYAQRATRKHECPVCDVPFTADGTFTVDRFLAKMKRLAEAAPERSRQTHESLDEMQKKQAALSGVARQFESVIALRGDPSRLRAGTDTWLFCDLQWRFYFSFFLSKNENEIRKQTSRN
jgi:hypothetical protein